LESALDIRRVLIYIAYMNLLGSRTTLLAEGLCKSYGSLIALADVDFRVEDGEIVAILGPNGAGKTTLIEILEGFRRPDAGRIEVLGQDPTSGGRRFRERVGLMLQECEAEPYLSVAELLELYRGYYRTPRSVRDLVELVGLEEKAQARIRTLSSGQRRRLDMAVALVGDPALLFMDEPTTGFDPEARHIAWETVRGLRERGTTIVLTTHYLEEAETLADRVVVLAGGRVRAEGTPDTVGGRDRVGVRISFAPLVDLGPEDMPVPIDEESGSWTVQADSPTKSLAVLASWAVERGVELEGLSVSRPSLEDTYLELIR
jgi:ABC-2 type transport system ATP-binding protein